MFEILKNIKPENRFRAFCNLTGVPHILADGDSGAMLKNIYPGITEAAEAIRNEDFQGLEACWAKIPRINTLRQFFEARSCYIFNFVINGNKYHKDEIPENFLDKRISSVEYRIGSNAGFHIRLDNGLRKVLAVDFDGTLCEERYPDIGAPKTEVINKVLEYKAAGWDTVLFTNREGKDLIKALLFCRKYGLHFNAVNDSTEEWKLYYNNNPRKIGFTLFVDDKSVSPSDFSSLEVML